jgi:hypothetical protein
MLHAVAKAIRQPRIEVCRWDSPQRFQLSITHGGEAQ